MRACTQSRSCIATPRLFDQSPLGLCFSKKDGRIEAYFWKAGVLNKQQNVFMERNQISWMNSKLVSRDTAGYGKGIYAIEKIKKDETIVIFGGHVMTLDQEGKLEGNLSDYSLQIDDNLVIGPAFIDEVSEGEHFNHSCSPNAGFKGQIMLVAMRDINPEEEVAFDYAMVISGDLPYEMECLCASDNCRKKITHTDWKIPEIQERYKEYFQYYIQKKINVK